MYPRDKGQEMRKLRASSNYKTLTDVENEGVRRWGWEGRIGRHQISRLENGLIINPDSNMLGKLSILYDVPVTTLFDIWDVPYQGQKAQPKYREVSSLATMLPRLSELARSRVLASVRTALDMEVDKELEEAADANREAARPVASSRRRR